MPGTRQQARAANRQLKKDFFRGAKAADVIETLTNLSNAVNNINFNFYALFEMLKGKMPGITEEEFLKKRQELLEKGQNNATANR